MQVIEVDAKALKKIQGNELEFACLFYVESLGFVTGNVQENTWALSQLMQFNEVEKEQYEQGISLQVSGDYDFQTKRLEIATYSIQKDA